MYAEFSDNYFAFLENGNFPDGERDDARNQLRLFIRVRHDLSDDVERLNAYQEVMCLQYRLQCDWETPIRGLLGLPTATTKGKQKVEVQQGRTG